MRKWLIGILVALFITIYLLSFMYTKLYHIDLKDNSDISKLKTDSSKSAYSYFDRPYNTEYELKREAYTLRFQAFLNSTPRIAIKAISQNNQSLSFENHILEVPRECGAFYNERAFDNQIIAVLSISRCSAINIDDFGIRNISFSIVNSQGSILGQEQLQFTINPNGFAAYPDRTI